MRTKGTCCVSCTARNAAALTPPPLSICSACAGEAFKAAKAAITNSEGTDGSDSGDDSDTAADSTGGPANNQGSTALGLAEARGDTALVELLQPVRGKGPRKG